MLHFNPQGSREPRLHSRHLLIKSFQISIHKALASLDEDMISFLYSPYNFNPQGSREPRHIPPTYQSQPYIFQSTRLSRASTLVKLDEPVVDRISIHKALASLDGYVLLNPRLQLQFQSTRLSRASTGYVAEKARL